MVNLTDVMGVLYQVLVEEGCDDRFIIDSMSIVLMILNERCGVEISNDSMVKLDDFYEVVSKVF